MSSSHRISFHQGDHVCALYNSPEEQLRAAVEYIRGGLSRKERCLFVCVEHTPDEIRAALHEAGVDPEAEEKRGALLLILKEEGHLKGGFFDPDKMISLLGKAVQEALDADFEGLCAGGDMSWVLDNAPGADRLGEYEARLNEFYRTHRALGLCLYNRRTLPAEVLDHGIATHQYIRIDGPVLLENPFYEAPEEAQRRTANPAHLPHKLGRIYTDPSLCA